MGGEAVGEGLPSTCLECLFCQFEEFNPRDQGAGWGQATHAGLWPVLPRQEGAQQLCVGLYLTGAKGAVTARIRTQL